MGAVVAAGALEAFVALLQTGPDEVKDNAASALASIAHVEQHAGAVVAAGAVEAFAAVLQTGPDDAMRNAAGALGNISAYKQHVNAVVAAGVIQVCVTVLQTGPDDAKTSAMCVLANISYHEQHVEHLVEAGVITLVLDGMQSMNSELKFIAALTSASFSDRLDVAVVVDAAAALVRELQRVEGDEELKLPRGEGLKSDAVRICMRALTRILRHKQHVDAVVAVGVVAALARVHKNGSRDIKCEASIALGLISKAERSQINH